MPTALPDVDVVVIGAGLAGLGAATALRDAGRSALVLEASGRIGGRAWTTHPAELGGVWFDMGALWLHNAETNPLVPIARAAGETLLRSDELRVERTFVGTREATEDEYADYAGAWSRFEDRAAAILRTRNDAPLADVARSMPADPWAVTVETWEGPIICCASADEFSARDWLNNVLSGSNLVPQGGIGALRRAAAGRRPRHQAGNAGDADCVGWRRRTGGNLGRHRHRAVCHRDRLDRRARRRHDPLRPATAGCDEGRDRRLADGAGGQGGAACNRPGSARPAAALLGRSPGEAQRRSHDGFPVLAATGATTCRAGSAAPPRGSLHAPASRRRWISPLASCVRCSAVGWTACSRAARTS